MNTGEILAMDRQNRLSLFAGRKGRFELLGGSGPVVNTESRRKPRLARPVAVPDARPQAVPEVFDTPAVSSPARRRG